MDAREVERKFRLPALPDPRLLGAGVSVAQGYLPVDPAEMRIRQKGERYYLTVKGDGDVDRAEWETEVPRWVFDRLWPQTAARQVHKTRYSVAHAGLVLEIDEYHGGLAGLVTLECEFPTLDAATTFVLPDWARAAEEVSSDARFKNRRLAERGLPQ
jgi:CYTH domain-containing protein